jgi:hypothetical protein
MADKGMSTRLAARTVGLVVAGAAVMLLAAYAGASTAALSGLALAMVTTGVVGALTRGRDWSVPVSLAAGGLVFLWRVSQPLAAEFGAAAASCAVGLGRALRWLSGRMPGVFADPAADRRVLYASIIVALLIGLILSIMLRGNKKAPFYGIAAAVLVLVVTSTQPGNEAIRKGLDDAGIGVVHGADRIR